MDKRGMFKSTQTILPSAARAVSGNTNSFKVGTSENIRLYVDVTVEPGVATLDIIIQTSPDNTKWYDAKTMTQITAIGQFTDLATQVGPYVRASYTIGGAGGFTFEMKLAKFNLVS